MIKQLKIFLYRIAFIRELFYLAGIRGSYYITEHNSIFIKANTPYWKDIKASNENSYILMEGFLSAYGLNYLLRTGMVAKSLEEKTGLTPLVLFNDYAYRSYQAEQAYRSFNISHFVYLGSNLFFRGVHNIISFFLASWYYLRIKNGKELIELRYGNIHIGDLIYDDIIKNLPEDYTVNTINKKHFRFFREAFYDFGIYNSILKKCKIKYLVATHTVYIKYGILARLAMYHGAEILETNDVHLVHYKEFDKKKNRSIPSYLSGINEWIKLELKTLDFTPDKLEWVDKYLENRFLGNFDQLDINLAFKDKKNYSKEELKKQLGITNDSPMVFLLAHAFSDAPHLSKFMIFKDYYDWLVQTLEIAKDIKNVNWIFKPHPTAKLFNEVGIVEKVVNAYHCEHFYIAPKDFNTNSVKEMAHALLTTQGTAGLEFSCLGVPVIITGRPMYAEFGFTHEPETKEAYQYQLKNISSLQKLSVEQVITAKKVYYLYEQFSLVDNDLIKMETLKKVWHFDEGTDKTSTYYEIADNLTAHNPRDQRLYKRVKDYIAS